MNKIARRGMLSGLMAGAVGWLTGAPAKAEQPKRLKLRRLPPPPSRCGAFVYPQTQWSCPVHGEIEGHVVSIGVPGRVRTFCVLCVMDALANVAASCEEVTVNALCP